MSSIGDSASLSSWLNEAPEENLLETDIQQGSYNVAPWGDKQEQGLWSSSKLVLQKEVPQDPFKDMTIADTAPLREIRTRSSCPKCERSRKYFCYTCHVALPDTAPLLPRITSLPIKVDVIKHPHELDGKSTAVHAALICPSHVRVWTYPEVPFEEYAKERALLVFPGEEALSMEEAFDVEKRGEDVAFDRVIFVDCTWNQVGKIIGDSRISSLPKVMLTNRETLFWRNQTGKPKEYLGTIEAIYYFTCDFHTKVLKKEYNGEYDNLLFLFKFMYKSLQHIYSRW